MKPSQAVKNRANRIVRLLAKLYPDAKCALHHDNPLQLLIATILSAQCTDVRVNMVTPALFARFPNVRAFAEAEQGFRRAIQINPDNVFARGSCGCYLLRMGRLEEARQQLTPRRGVKLEN